MTSQLKRLGVEGHGKTPTWLILMNTKLKKMANGTPSEVKITNSCLTPPVGPHASCQRYLRDCFPALAVTFTGVNQDGFRSFQENGCLMKMNRYRGVGPGLVG